MVWTLAFTLVQLFKYNIPCENYVSQGQPKIVRSVLLLHTLILAHVQALKVNSEEEM